MSYELCSKGECHEVVVAESFTKEEMFEVFYKLESVLKQQVGCVLIDARKMTSHASILDISEISASFGKNSRRFAIVSHPNFYDVGAMSLDIANSHHRKVAHFLDIDKAKAWLSLDTEKALN